MKQSKTPQAGWPIAEYLPLIGNPSRSYLYALPPELQPRSIKLGSRRVITEAPEDYLARRSKDCEQEGAA